MNPFQQIPTLAQLQYCPQIQQLQQLQQLQYLQLLCALQSNFANQQNLQIPSLNPLQQISLLSQSSQRTIPIIQQPDIRTKKSQSERVLPKQKKENEILKQFTQDEILQELKQLLEYLCKEEIKVLEENEKIKYKILTRIDDGLIESLINRYQNQKKTKEEQIKFILRKCFKFLKQKMNLNELTMSAYEIEKVFYKEYFSSNDNIEELIPFRSESSNKTMNTSYLKKIFSSEKFYEGYLSYLEHFDEIWDQENNEKIQNMAKQVLKFIASGQIDKISTYKRVPWILSMKQRCYELAVSFKAYHEQDETCKKVKQE
ncbi:unnamed protein product [Paramecium primaurelia]|uniref:Uncharacterized protein n=1 Tax=Paramecium primaurelia TaxID=5886 RepID=A0A8S1Q3I9_PARPR|nr:unnamed protein product [Paramecium primaurelia]